MPLSRREALAGSAAAVSMLVARPGQASPALPAFPRERIYDDGEPFEENPGPWSTFSNADNQLIGVYHLSAPGRSAFSFDLVKNFMHSARFARESDADHRAVFMQLLSDNRTRLLTDELARRLFARAGAGDLSFRTTDGWMTIAQRHSFHVTIRRRDAFPV